MRWFDALGSEVSESQRESAVDEAEKIGLEISIRPWIDRIADYIENDRPDDAIEETQERLDPTGTYRLLAVLCTPSTDKYRNPMRFSIAERDIDLSDYPVEVTEIEVRPSGGNLHVHWRDPSGREDPIDRETLREAVDTWGLDAQVSMAEEEAAEFIVASKHYARDKVDADRLVDELADLRIMCEQLAEFVGREDVEQRVEEKMDRLRERIEEAE